jgi:hypothetical protein
MLFLWGARWWILAAALVGWIYLEHLELAHSRTELTAAKATIARMDAAGKAQAAAAAQLTAEASKRESDLQAQLQAQLQTAALSNRSLTLSLRQYAAAHCSGAVPSKPAGPAGGSGPSAGASGPGFDQRVTDALSALPGACQAVIDQLSTCQSWARSVKCNAVP